MRIIVLLALAVNLPLATWGGSLGLVVLGSGVHVRSAALELATLSK
jgi:hypothetical protein